MLVRAGRDRRSPWRTPVLSTVGADGAPRARILVLRRAEPETGRLWLHTDARSAKVGEIGAEPRVALTHYDPRRALQLRVEGVARLETDPAVLALAWAQVPDAARHNYVSELPPGSPADGGPAWSRGDQAVPDAAAAGDRVGGERAVADGVAHFALLAVEAQRLEWLWLGPHGHRRGEALRTSDGWAGRALIP